MRRAWGELYLCVADRLTNPATHSCRWLDGPGGGREVPSGPCLCGRRSQGGPPRPRFSLIANPPISRTYNEQVWCVVWCGRPTGGRHGLTTDDPAQRFKGAKRRTAPGTKETQRRPGQYSGWGPTPSFAAARESYPSRGLLQRCYKSAYRGQRFCCIRQQAREGSACSLCSSSGYSPRWRW
jgi:hypothetical protein